MHFLLQPSFVLITLTGSNKLSQYELAALSCKHKNAVFDSPMLRNAKPSAVGSQFQCMDSGETSLIRPSSPPFLHTYVCTYRVHRRGTQRKYLSEGKLSSSLIPAFPPTNSVVKNYWFFRASFNSASTYTNNSPARSADTSSFFFAFLFCPTIRSHLIFSSPHGILIATKLSTFAPDAPLPQASTLRNPHCELER